MLTISSTNLTDTYELRQVRLVGRFSIAISSPVSRRSISSLPFLRYHQLTRSPTSFDRSPKDPIDREKFGRLETFLRDVVQHIRGDCRRMCPQ